MGIWHGASFNYLFFGIFHGLGLILNHLWRVTNIKINNVLSWFILFLFINISFLIFYSPDFEVFKNILKGMIGLNGIGLKDLRNLHLNEILNTNLGANFHHSKFEIYSCIIFINNLDFFKNKQRRF